MNVEGVWQVTYTAIGFNFDPDQKGIVVIQDGIVMGRDLWGGQYNGTYTQQGSHLQVKLAVDRYEVDSDPVMPWRAYPFTLDLQGEYNDAKHFFITGRVVDEESTMEVELTVHCNRLI